MQLNPLEGNDSKNCASSCNQMALHQNMKSFNSNVAFLYNIIISIAENYVNSSYKTRLYCANNFSDLKILG